MARKASVLKQAQAIAMAHRLFPSFLRQQEAVERLDSWHRGSTPGGEGPYAPRETTPEYQQLSTLSPTPWLSLVVTSLVQMIFLEGVYMPGKEGDLEAYQAWQRNGWDAKQTALYRASMAHGASFGVALPGSDPLTGARMPLMRPVSARRMAAFYESDVMDNWATSAIEADKVEDSNASYGYGYTVTLYDESALYYLACEGDGEDINQWTFISYDEHPAGITPVVRYPNSLDLDGRTQSAIEPLIPLARRLDQDTFDRLIVQRFGAWKIRYIAGLAKPDSAEDQVALAMRLKVEDLLISDNKDTKFGTLDATDIAGFIAARDHDLRDMSAVSQTPPHHMLGLSSNLQAESLAAAEAGLLRKGVEHKTLWGECHEQMFRLVAKIQGNREEVEAYNMQVRWRDMESRSLSQTVDALSKAADSLEIPLEMLWERFPNWTDLDTERAKRLVENGSIDRLIEALGNQPPPEQGGPDANAG